ncbi:MAG: rRNA maturation RNase YbeY [Candidatus Omnitrophota bacterium]|jgi:probable rRNA maturation factor
MIRIRVDNLNSSRPLDEAFIKRLALKALPFVKVPEKVQIEIVILDDKRIRALNKKYKRADRPTDVLSFDIGGPVPSKPGTFFGVIYISSDTASRNSKVFNTSFDEELVLYVIHGILHLFGYEDERPKDRLKMSKKQERILKILCTKENLSRVSTRR